MKKNYIKYTVIILVLFTVIFYSLAGMNKMKTVNEVPKGEKLLTLYVYEETDAYKEVGESQKLLYDDKNPYSSIIKFKVHQNGVELKLEEMDYRESKGKWSYVILGTLFELKPEKGGIYSYKGSFPEGSAYQRLTVKYKGKSVKYNLDWGLMLVDTGDEDGPMETTEKDLYSGDKGD